MQERGPFGPLPDPAAAVRGARVRSVLLEQVRYALTTEPAALDVPADVPADHLIHIRGRVSITVGAIVVRLNQEGFDQSDRLYSIRDVLAEGRAVNRDDLEWLNTTIAFEKRLSSLPGDFPAF